MNAGNRPINFIRFDMFKNKKLLLEKASLFDGICMPAHLKSYFRNASMNFLYEMYKIKKPFFIDPMTYLFQSNPSEFCDDKGRLKQSIKKLTDDYDGLIKSIFGSETRPREIRPSDFREGFGLENLIKNCIKFQQEGYEELTTLMNKYEIKTTIKPQPIFLLSPYFYFKNTEDRWFDINVDISKKLRECSGGKKIFSVIVTDFNCIMNNGEISKIIESFSSDVDGYFVWISHDKNITVREIKQKIKLIEGLSKTSDIRKEIYLMFGSFCSVPLHYRGLTGFCHGTWYSENRNVHRGIGGGPIAKRYYIEKLHNFIDVSRIYRAEDVLSEILVNPSIIGRMTEKQLIIHFLNARHNENILAGKTGETDFIKKVEEEYDEIEDVMGRADIDTTQLRSIIDAFI